MDSQFAFLLLNLMKSYVLIRCSFMDLTEAMILTYSTSTDKCGEIVSIDHRSLDYIKYKDYEIIGKNLTVLMPKILIEKHGPLIKATMQTPEINIGSTSKYSYIRTKDDFYIYAQIQLLFSKYLQNDGCILGVLLILPLNNILEDKTDQFLAESQRLSCICDNSGSIVGVTEEFYNRFNMKEYEDELPCVTTIFPELINLALDELQIIDSSTYKYLAVKKKQMFKGQQIGIVYELLQTKQDKKATFPNDYIKYSCRKQQKQIIDFPQITNSLTDIDIYRSKMESSIQKNLVNMFLPQIISNSIQLLKIVCITVVCWLFAIQRQCFINNISDMNFLIHQFERVEHSAMLLIWIQSGASVSLASDLNSEGCEATANFLSKPFDPIKSYRDMYEAIVYLSNYFCSYSSIAGYTNYTLPSFEISLILTSQKSISDSITDCIKTMKDLNIQLEQSPMILILCILIVIMLIVAIIIKIKIMRSIHHKFKCQVENNLAKIPLSTISHYYQQYLNSNTTLCYLIWIRNEFFETKPVETVIAKKEQQEEPNDACVDAASEISMVSIEKSKQFSIMGYLSIICKIVVIMAAGILLILAVIAELITMSTQFITMHDYSAVLMSRQLNLEMLSLLLSSIESGISVSTNKVLFQQTYDRSLLSEQTILSFQYDDTYFSNKLLSIIGDYNSDQFCDILSMSQCNDSTYSFHNFGLRNIIQRYLSLANNKFQKSLNMAYQSNEDELEGASISVIRAIRS